MRLLSTVSLIFAFSLMMVVITASRGRSTEGLRYALGQDANNQFYLHPINDPTHRTAIRGLYGTETFYGWFGHYAVFTDAYGLGLVRVHVNRARTEPFATMTAPPVGVLNNVFGRVSPDGTKFVLDQTSQIVDPAAGTISTPATEAEGYIWYQDRVIYAAAGTLVRADNATHTPLYSSDGHLRLLEVSNAGHWLYFTESPTTRGPYHLLRLNLMTLEHELLLARDTRHVARNGRYLYVLGGGSVVNGVQYLHRVDLLGEEAPQTLVDNMTNNRALSGNGNWLAYTDNAAHLHTIDLTTGLRFQVTMSPTDNVRFLPDGRLVFDVQRRDAVVSVVALPDGRERDRFDAGAPVLIGRDDRNQYALVNNALYRVDQVGWRDYIGEGRPVPSPDGRYIALVQRTPARIQIYDTVTETLTVAFDESSWGLSVINVQWTENGLVFDTYGINQRWFMLPDGSALRELPLTLFADANPDATAAPIVPNDIHTGRLLGLALGCGLGAAWVRRHLV